jgi:hypothetical protein
MTSKIFKNNQIFEIMNSMAITLKEILKALEIPLEKFRNLKKIYIMTPMRIFISFHDAPLHYTPRPSMDLQDSSKGTSSKRKKVSS